MLKETIIVSVIVFGILTISWFYFSWKIEKEEKEKKEKSILKQRSGEIAVAGIRQKNDNGLAFKFRPFG